MDKNFLVENVVYLTNYPIKSISRFLGKGCAEWPGWGWSVSNERQFFSTTSTLSPLYLCNVTKQLFPLFWWGQKLTTIKIKNVHFSSLNIFSLDQQGGSEIKTLTLVKVREVGEGYYRVSIFEAAWAEMKMSTILKSNSKFKSSLSKSWIHNENWNISNRAFYRCRQANFGYGHLILSRNQFSLLPQRPLKMTLAIKVVKIDHLATLV